ncbi:homoserine dehydrogenase [Sphingomonas ginkgonis]|uniref:Homoserine dehydrogenase n=1 Tax=Sphingomonas ginkgonis TaxID=2315330 RepID=A0A3R9WLY2_9SPHN|nr:homoserine dehydrogenase [Sphingomonas ginkgonis]RST29532.1 homoserine dehydrogenase [Sphingomonas ginkgonis]
MSAGKVDATGGGEAALPRLLRFDGPLEQEQDLLGAASVIYDCWRRGERVLAVAPDASTRLTDCLDRLGFSRESVSVVAEAPTANPDRADAEPRRLRVALLGCGAVGGGVLELLRARPDQFELAPVLVRNLAASRGPGLFTATVEEALAPRPDILIELMGGADGPADLMRSALLDGIQVVTANKAAVARHWDSLHACASRGGGELRYSAAVGGGVPIIETVRRCRNLAKIEGVMNGTCNFILGLMGKGRGFDSALAKAQAMGFAEADPSGDVDGHDAADKLAILIREAFGIALAPDRIARQSLREITPATIAAAAARGEVLKQVASCRHYGNGSLDASVQIVALPAEHPLAAPQREENCFLLTDGAGTVTRVFGKGAGRWPTALAVFADVMDAQRALLGRAEPRAATDPLRLTA